MELDDLRRHWRQPEPATPLSGAELTTLLNGRTANLVEKMRLAARLETCLGILVAAALLMAIVLSKNGLVRAYSAGAGLVVGVLLVLYYRMLAVLRQMVELTGSVHSHLATLVQGMRHLLRFYYRLSLSVIPLLALVVVGYVAWQLAAADKVQHWRPIGRAAGGFLLVGTLGQALIVYGTRWWVQRLYGRHLDRLEGQLRELEEAG